MPILSQYSINLFIYLEIEPSHKIVYGACIYGFYFSYCNVNFLAFWKFTFKNSKNKKNVASTTFSTSVDFKFTNFYDSELLLLYFDFLYFDIFIDFDSQFIISIFITRFFETNIFKTTDVYLKYYKFYFLKLLYIQVSCELVSKNWNVQQPSSNYFLEFAIYNNNELFTSGSA